MVPHIEVSALKGSCGQFIEKDGWVKPVVSTEFALESAASRAILCHELSHYILFANGIRMAGRVDNERLTDIAMFVLGMGGIFVNGFRSKNVGPYRRGHRMGYLTDEEYNFLSGDSHTAPDHRRITIAERNYIDTRTFRKDTAHY
jgi:hypothetical protein